MFFASPGAAIGGGRKVRCRQKPSVREKMPDLKAVLSKEAMQDFFYRQPPEPAFFGTIQKAMAESGNLDAVKIWKKLLTDREACPYLSGIITQS